MKKSSQKPIKRTALRAVSQKRQAQKNEYDILKLTLMEQQNRGGYYISELDGEISKTLEVHHIDGKQGKRLFDPFNLILITPEQHLGDNGIQKHNSWEAKQKLLGIVRKIRLEQGFLEEGKC
jgi:hypothetical protein